MEYVPYCEFPKRYTIGDIEVRFEQTTPGYAYAYTLYKNEKAIGQVFSGKESPKNVATIAASFALLDAIKEMRHDIEIFYAHHREPGNKYHANLNKVLEFIKKESYDRN